MSNDQDICFDLDFDEYFGLEDNEWPDVRRILTQQYTMPCQKSQNWPLSRKMTKGPPEKSIMAE